MTEFINNIKRFKLLIFILIFMIPTASLIYSGQKSQKGYKFNGTQPFTIDLSLTDEEEVIFRLISADGKEKVEVIDGKFADGTKILESRGFIYKSKGWQQIGAGQSEYKEQDKIRFCGYQEYLIYEAVEPNIASMEYKDENKIAKVPFIEVKGRRFAAIYRFFRPNYSYQINFLNKNGEAILIRLHD